jgi:hypothetical protein
MLSFVNPPSLDGSFTYFPAAFSGFLGLIFLLVVVLARRYLRLLEILETFVRIERYFSKCRTRRLNTGRDKALLNGAFD